MTPRLLRVTLVAAAISGMVLGTHQQAMAGRWNFKPSLEGGPHIWEYQHDDGDYSHLSNSAPAVPHPRNVEYSLTLYNPSDFTIGYSLNDQKEPRLKPGESVKWIIMGSAENPASFNIAFDNGRQRQIRYNLRNNSSSEFLDKGAGVDLFNNDRHTWSYQGGSVKDKGTGHWVEVNASGQYGFREVKRTIEYVELYDKSRDCTVRLHPGEMYLKGLQRFPNFVKAYNGSWVN